MPHCKKTASQDIAAASTYRKRSEAKSKTKGDKIKSMFSIIISLIIIIIIIIIYLLLLKK